MHPADTESGKYRGEFIAETDHHLVQKISAKSAAVHLKHLLPTGLTLGETAVVAYSGGVAELKPHRTKERAVSLSR